MGGGRRRRAGREFRHTRRRRRAVDVERPRWRRLARRHVGMAGGKLYDTLGRPTSGRRRRRCSASRGAGLRGTWRGGADASCLRPAQAAARAALRGHASAVRAAAWSPNEVHVASAGAGGEILLHRVQDSVAVVARAPPRPPATGGGGAQAAVVAAAVGRSGGRRRRPRRDVGLWRRDGAGGAAALVRRARRRGVGAAVVAGQPPPAGVVRPRPHSSSTT